MENALFIYGSLAIAPTDNCNLKCAHCSCGDARDIIVNTKIIEAVFKNIMGVNQLYFIGGEPFMAFHKIAEIMKFVMQKGVYVLSWGLTTNGSLYKKEYEQVFQEFDEYVAECRRKMKQPKLNNDKNIRLSWGLFHQAELGRIMQENPSLCDKYMRNINELCALNRVEIFQYLNGPIFTEGRASEFQEFPDIYPQEYIPFNLFSYTDENAKLSLSPFSDKTLTLVGPSIAVLAEGTVCDCDASYESASGNLKLGNLNEEELINIIARHAVTCGTLEEFKSKHDQEYDKKKRNGKKNEALPSNVAK